MIHYRLPDIIKPHFAVIKSHIMKKTSKSVVIMLLFIVCIDRKRTELIMMMLPAVRKSHIKMKTSKSVVIMLSFIMCIYRDRAELIVDCD